MSRMGAVAGCLCTLWLSALCAEGREAVADIDRRFVGESAPIRMTYGVTYRFLGLEWADLGQMDIVSRTGVWRHRVGEVPVPAVFLDIRVRSRACLDSDGGRTRINDRMIAVVERLSMNVLVFAKETDEQLNPVFGRRSVSKAVSCYDMQGDTLEYYKQDLLTGDTTTRLTEPAAIYQLSRQVGSILSFLSLNYRGQTHGKPQQQAGSAIAVNLDGNVVRLHLVTQPDKSPLCLQRRRLDALRVQTVMEKHASVRSRDFNAWGMPFSDLAAVTGDAGLQRAARQAPVDAFVPLAIDYELALGSVRVVMKGSAVVPVPAASPSGAKRPETMGQEDAAAGDGFGGQFGQHGAHAKAMAEDPHQNL